MKTIKVFAFLLLTIMLCFPIYVSAVRAYPYPVEVKQPNGETITIQAHGDEFFHYVTTIDGYVVDVDSEGYFTFAEINSKGYIRPGKVRVSESALISDNKSFLKANSPEFIEKVKNPAIVRASLIKKEIQPLRSKSMNILRSAENTTVENTKALVILAEFQDVPFSIENPQQAFTNMLNQSGYSPVGSKGFTGSVRDYFISSSDDAYRPEFIVYGPVKLPYDMVFYGENDADGYDKNPGQMIVDACNAAKDMYPDLNFTAFPRNKNDVLDNVCVIYSGYNEAENSKTLPNTIWPHQYYLDVKDSGFSLSDRTVDGVVLDAYMCTSELKGSPSAKNMAGVGTFAHEYSHVLGLPDLYDANGSVDGTITTEPGLWDIMSAGNYLNSGNTPPSYSAIERWWLEWMDLFLLGSGGVYSLTIPPITSSKEKKAFVVDTSTDLEFFTLEVRKNESWDSFLQGEGMLIYHIDLNNDVIYSTEYGDWSMLYLWFMGVPNIIGDHPGVKLLTANRETMSYNNYAGHSFPGANNVTSISDDTNPGFLSWNNGKSGVSITNITRSPKDGSVSFTYSNKGASGIKENNIHSPFAFSNDNIVFFKNISGNTQVNIYDVKGILYLSKNIYEPDNLEITVPGVYVVKLQTNNEVFTYKIIIR